MYMHLNAHLPPLDRQQKLFINSGMTMALKDKPSLGTGKNHEIYEVIVYSIHY